MAPPMTRPAAHLPAPLRALAAFVLLVSALLAPAAAQLDLEDLDIYIEGARKDFSVPGLAIAIFQDDRPIFVRGYGTLEEGGEVAVNGDTLFAIASNTKAFTAASLAILVDEGKISWDDRVIEYLPYFRLYDPWVTNEMRIRDLLSHRSGLGTFSGDLMWYGSYYDAAEVVRRAQFLKPAGPFRAHYGYSNIMFIAAGEVVAKVAGIPFGDFVENRILAPLGMDRTVTAVSELSTMENVATPHGEIEGKVHAFEWQPWVNSVAAGGIVSSVNDMSRWLRLQLRRGELDGEALFSREAADEMWTPHISIKVDDRSRKETPSTHYRSYGLGWSLMDFHGHQIVQHGGGFDGMFSRVALVPEKRVGMVILTNSMTPLPVALMYRILDDLLSDEVRDWSATYVDRASRSREQGRSRLQKALQKRAGGTSSSRPLAAYVGEYSGELYGPIEVSLENGRLQLSFRPNPALVGRLRHLHYDTFVLDWDAPFPWFGSGTAHFIIDRNGAVERLELEVPNDDFWFTELELARQ